MGEKESEMKYRIRHPLPFGRSEFWPGEYDDKIEALRERMRAGSPVAEIVDESGNVVIQSERAFKRLTRGKNGRP